VKDLVFLVADVAMRELVSGFFARDHAHTRLECGPFQFNPRADILLGPPGTYDSGIYGLSHTILTAERAAEYCHAVIMVDQRWGGSPGQAAIRARITRDLTGASWTDDRICPIVFADDVERWIWANNTHVETAMQFRSSRQSLRAFLASDAAEPMRVRGEACDPAWPADADKPRHPKQARMWVQHHTNCRKGSELFAEISCRMTVQGCTDPEFAQLVTCMQRWFP